MRTENIPKSSDCSSSSLIILFIFDNPCPFWFIFPFRVFFFFTKIIQFSSRVNFTFRIETNLEMYHLAALNFDKPSLDTGHELLLTQIYQYSLNLTFIRLESCRFSILLLPVWFFHLCPEIHAVTKMARFKKSFAKHSECSWVCWF